MPRNKFHKKSNRGERKKRTNRKNIKAGIKAGINNLSNNDSNKDFFIKIGKKVKESNKSNEILKMIDPVIQKLSLLNPQGLDILAAKLRENSDNSDLYIQNFLNDTKQSRQTGGAEDGGSPAMLFLIGIALYLYNIYLDEILGTITELNELERLRRNRHRN